MNERKENALATEDFLANVMCRPRCSTNQLAGRYVTARKFEATLVIGCVVTQLLVARRYWRVAFAEIPRIIESRRMLAAIRSAGAARWRGAQPPAARSRDEPLSDALSAHLTALSTSRARRMTSRTVLAPGQDNQSTSGQRYQFPQAAAKATPLRDS
ncbi:hypothetical protein ACJJTC_003075 [Scirpophaga incertulas]